MNQYSTEPEYILDSTSKKGLQVVISETSIQSFLDLEVDLVVFSREQSKLVAMCTRIIEDLRNLRVQVQDMELP